MGTRERRNRASLSLCLPFLGESYSPAVLGSGLKGLMKLFLPEVLSISWAVEEDAEKATVFFLHEISLL